jgi:membrane protease YdiL (CAAX protease family)
MQSFHNGDDEIDDVYTPLPEPAPIDTTSIRRAWIGLLITTIAFFPVYSPFKLLYPSLVRWLQVRTFYEEIAVDLLYESLRVGCVFLIIAWDGAPLGVFGLKKPRWSVDTVTAVIAFALHWKFVAIATDLLANVLLTWGYKIPAHHRGFHFHMPEQSCAGIVLLFIYSLSIGLFEELVTRGYLIPRLERVLNSKLWAVLISSAFFGCWHWPNGMIAVWGAFGTGIIYGIVFVATRRLWPTAVAHAMFDFVLFLWRA